jgi:RNA-directed DNA polymerase
VSAERLTQGQTRWSIPLSSRMPNPTLYSALARSILAGAPGVEQIAGRLSRTLGREWRWLKPLARRFAASNENQVRPRREQVERFLRDDSGLQRAIARYSNEIRVAAQITEAQQMQPVPAAADWGIPAIESSGALAEWLHLSESELEWFADRKGLTSCRDVQGAALKLNHYHYRVLAKKSGSVRLIEEPKQHLKQIQRQILSEILDPIPIHPSVHGFVRGRSIRTFAAPHVGRCVVLRLDLQDFFPSFAARRIQAFFRTAGYPESVADRLGGLCTNAAPVNAWKELGKEIDRAALLQAKNLYSRPHLPQGAPTSPALANLCSFRIDCRLSGLAASVGAAYTRYADDLAFSGEENFERQAERFAAQAGAILLEEGFTIQHHKTRIMRQGVRQYLAGLVANQRINVVRTDFDRLKAILHNCIQHGPESQNREHHANFRAHVEGRVGFVESIYPGKGKRLRQMLEQIRWR